MRSKGGKKVPRPHVGRTNKGTVLRVNNFNMIHHATFGINRRDMAVCRFFKMAPVRHVGFLKFRNCNCRTLRSIIVRYRAKFRVDRSSRCRDVSLFDLQHVGRPPSWIFKTLKF